MGYAFILESCTEVTATDPVAMSSVPQMLLGSVVAVLLSRDLRAPGLWRLNAAAYRVTTLLFAEPEAPGITTAFRIYFKHDDCC